MLIFIDLDGTLFDTYSLNPTNVGEWITAYQEAPLMEGANKTLAQLDIDGHFCMAITKRGEMLGQIEYDLSKRAILTKMNPPTSIKGLLWKIDNKTQFILNNLDTINKRIGTSYSPEQVVLIDNDESEIARAAAAGFFSILFGSKIEANKTELPKNLRIAKNWAAVRDILKRQKSQTSQDENEGVQ